MCIVLLNVSYHRVLGEIGGGMRGYGGGSRSIAWGFSCIAGGNDQIRKTNIRD